MKTAGYALALACCAFVLSSPVSAQQGGPPPDGAMNGGPRGGGPLGGGPRQACMSDAQTFCKNVQPGGGRIIECLKDHYKEISDGCYQALQKMASRGGPQGSPPGGPPSGGSQDGSSQGDDFKPGHNAPPPPSDDDGGNGGDMGQQ